MFSAGAGVFFPEPEFFLPEPEVKNPEFAQHYSVLNKGRRESWRLKESSRFTCPNKAIESNKRVAIVQ